MIKATKLTHGHPSYPDQNHEQNNSSSLIVGRLAKPPADSPNRPLGAVSKAIGVVLITKIRQAFRLLTQLVRELADETAFERHLDAAGKPRSAAEWRKFADERWKRKYGTAKCC